MARNTTLKAISITLDNVTTQLDILDDFITDVYKQHPETETYWKLFNYVWESIFDIQEKIKTL